MKRVALVHDWLVGMRGGEKVFEVLCELFPQADVYTLVYNPDMVSQTIRNMNVKTPWSTKTFPFLRKYYRYLLPLMPTMIEGFELRDYDLVISTSHCVAKGVRIIPETTPHLCYCFTPMRYIWDKFPDYFSSYKKIGTWIMPFAKDYLRRWDVETSQANRVRQFITSSEYVRERIRRHYTRDAVVLPPPVDCDRFTAQRTPRDFYLIVGALEPYKRVDIAIEAFNALGFPLKVVGSGSEFKRLANMAGPNVKMLGWVSDAELPCLYAQAKAFVFTADEDFGIVPLEASAAGCPVIAFGKGGALETVRNEVTGIFFTEQNADSLSEAVGRFEMLNFEEKTLREHARTFDRSVFKQRLAELIEGLSSTDRTIKFQSVSMVTAETNEKAF